MLIPSERHTPADLSLWAEYEDADRVHYEDGRVGVIRAVRAMAWVRMFLMRGPAYCAVSWGKDSVALADLVCREAAAVPLVWVRVEPVKNPDCEKVRDAFLSAHPRAEYHEVETRCGRSRLGWHATGTLEAGFREACRRFGDHRFSGVRSDESAARKLSRAVHGTATATSCRPILDWSAADVFAYLAHHRLPVHPAYAMTGGGRWDRGRIRVASLGGRRGDGVGRAEWEREYYGDVLRRLDAGRR